MPNKRIHIVIPEELASAIDALVGKRARSKFLADLAWYEVKRRRQLAALRAVAGSLKPEEYPEFRGGSARWVRQMRRQDEKRFQRIARAARK